MRSIRIALTASMLAVSRLAVAQEASAITPEMSAMETKLLAKLTPAQRTWIAQEAARQRSGTGEPGKLSAEALKSYPSLNDFANTDIEAIAFLVMMQGAKSAQEDLKSVMAGVKAINSQKASIRESERARAPVATTSSLQLQTTLDRRAKMLETAASLMKKMSEAGSTTVRNLK